MFFPSQPSSRGSFTSMLAEGGIVKEDLALLVGTVVHAWQLVGQAHRVAGSWGLVTSKQVLTFDLKQPRR